MDSSASVHLLEKTSEITIDWSHSDTSTAIKQHPNQEREALILAVLMVPSASSSIGQAAQFAFLLPGYFSH